MNGLSVSAFVFNPITMLIYGEIPNVTYFTMLVSLLMIVKGVWKLKYKQMKLRHDDLITYLCEAVN